MVDPVTNNYSFVLPTVGGDTNLWGGVLNNGVITAVDTTLAGVLSVSITSADVTLTAAQFQNAVFALTGTLTADRALIIPLSPNSATVACAGRFSVDNGTAGAFNVTVKTAASGSTGVVVPQGLRAWLYSDGTNVKYSDDSKVYIVPVNGTPNGVLAGTTGTVNNPPFPLAFDYTNKRLYLPTTTGNTTTTVWNNFVIGSSPLPTALFTSLAIKVTSNTTVTVAATGVSVTDGAGNYQTVVPPGTGTPINLGTTGANALDRNSIASSTWYAIWVIAKTDGTVACLASTSFTLAGLTLPSGYTYGGRVGAIRTSSSVAQLLGTWQFGRKAQYVVGLAQTSANPTVLTGATGSYSGTAPIYSAVSISNVVPTTASAINLILVPVYNNTVTGIILAAPNQSYSGPFTGNAPPGVANNTDSSPVSVSFLLESTNVSLVHSNANCGTYCSGWEDNI